MKFLIVAVLVLFGIDMLLLLVISNMRALIDRAYELINIQGEKIIDLEDKTDKLWTD